MECRDARSLIARYDHLTAEERQRLDRHLQTCLACADELEDSSWRLLPVDLPMAQPPTGLANSIIARLPALSPLDLATRQRARLQNYRRLGLGVAFLVPMLALAGVSTLQFPNTPAADRLSGLSLVLGLGAKAVLIVLGQPWVTALLLFALSMIVVVRFLPIARTLHPLLRSGMLVGALLGIFVLLGNAVAVHADRGTVLAQIDVQGIVSGDISSLAGNIDVNGEVYGDVVALTGQVKLGPSAHIHGSVLSAAGGVLPNNSQIDQAVVNGPSQSPLAAIGAANTSVSVVQAGWLLGMIAACAMLLFAAFVVVVWPQGSAQASAYLSRFPLQSFAFGVLITVALLGIAGGLSVIFAATIGGVLLVPIIILVLHLPYILGVAAVGEAFGLKLTGRPSLGGAIWGIAAQLLVVVAVGLLAAQGALIVFYLLASAGLGGLFLVRSHNYA